MKVLPVAISFLLLFSPLSGYFEEQPAGCTQTTCIQSDQLNLITYTLTNNKGETLDTWKDGETANLTLVFKDARIKTEVLFPEDTEIKPGMGLEGVDAEQLVDGFSQQSSVVCTLLSGKGEVLKFQVEYKNVKWNGKSDEFVYVIGYPSASLPYIKGSLLVSQCESPQSNENTDVEDKPSNEIDITLNDNPVTDITYSDPETTSQDGLYSPVVDTADSGESAVSSSSEDSENEESVATASPNLIISRYSYGSDSVEAGSAFTLTINFYNTSKTITTDNIVMSVEADDGLSITNASNTYYFEELLPRYSLQQKIDMRSISSDKTTSPTVTVTFNYEYVDNGVRSSKTSTERIAIPIYEPDRLEITEPAVEETITSEQELILSFPYVNKGKSTLYNVSAKVEGDLTSLVAIQNLGNFESGKSGTIDVILTPDEPGQKKFTVLITWENVNGEEITHKYPYTIKVLDSYEEDWYGDDYYEEDIPQEENSFPWIWVILVILVIVIASLLIFRHKTKKNKQGPDDRNGNPDTDIDIGTGEDDYFADLQKPLSRKENRDKYPGSDS